MPFIKEMVWWIVSPLPRGSAPARTDVSHPHVPCWRKGFSSPHVGVSPVVVSTGDRSFGMHVLAKIHADQTLWSLLCHDYRMRDHQCNLGRCRV